MQYDFTIPIAVFLGPTLTTDQAKDILKANYYPPIQMGDIYQLLATNVQVIIIIDGFFHANVPVWQREILSALKNGIKVIGAASMGALRAVELSPYGMIGIGQVYSWYQQELIEGDDEVALLHLNIEHDYYPLSEPLVNIRHTLDYAYQQGVITQQNCTAILAELKQLFYGDRSYATIFTCNAYKSLNSEVQRQLEAQINNRKQTIKQIDAIAALRLCQNMTSDDLTDINMTLSPGKDIPRPLEIYHRGALSTQGYLYKLQQLMPSVKQSDKQIQQIISNASQRFFLLQWIKLKQLTLPDHYFLSYKNTWLKTNNIDDFENWLTSNGLIDYELEQELKDRAAICWLTEHKPPELSSLQLKELTLIKSHFPDLAFQLIASSIIMDWTNLVGIDVPTTVLETATDDQKAIFSQQMTSLGFTKAEIQKLFELYFIAQKIVHKTPNYFGFDLWSADTVIIREHQVQGMFAKLAENHSLEHYA